MMHLAMLIKKLWHLVQIPLSLDKIFLIIIDYKIIIFACNYITDDNMNKGLSLNNPPCINQYVMVPCINLGDFDKILDK